MLLTDTNIEPIFTEEQNQSKPILMIMKKLYLLLLLFSGLTGFAVAPPIINDPTPLVVCDSLNDGFEVFDLTVKIPEVLGSLNPNLYALTFHETMTDAEINAFTISNPTAYQNINPLSQFIYIRVQEIATGDYSLTSLELVLNATPITNQPPNLTIEQIPFVGTAVFDITVNESLFLNGQTGVSVTYHTSLADAASNVNPIPTPTFYTGVNGETIWVVARNISGCFTIRSFRLFITNPDIVYIPDPIFKNYLVNHNPTIDSNGNNEIEYSEAALYGSIFLLSERNISDLTGVEAFINLRELHCNNNFLTSLNVSGLSNLTTLYCAYNQLSTLNVTGTTSLFTLECNNNQLTTLDVSNLSNLYLFFCDNNLLTTLNISGTTNLHDFACGFNQLTSIDVSSSSNLLSFGFENNPISAVDVSNLQNLTNLYCVNTLITTLDVSNCTSLNVLVFYDNANLTSVYMKNGRNEGINLTNCPNLSFICADETQINDVLQLLAQFLITDVVVNSYCSFSPGGNYNTIVGSIKYDGDGNGCDVNDGGLPNVRVNISDGTQQGATFSNVNGGYIFNTLTGTYNLEIGTENPSWFTISPATATVNFPDTNNNQSVQNFCITPNGVHPDLEIIIAPLLSARPGFLASYSLVIKNKGNQTITQANDGISFTYDPNRMSLVETSEPVSLLTAPPGTLNWDVLNLMPFQSKSITVVMNVNPPTHPTFPVNIGDVFNFTATANPIAGDESPSDNAFQLNQTVVGAYDPNNIICIEGNMVSPSEIGNYLHYVINFENTGNAAAENIVVREIIDVNQFDVTTLQLLDSSAGVTARLTGNVAEFIFSGINLEAGGHGNILLKMKTNNTLVEGDSVSKKVNIYFDYNFPVETLPENTLFQALSNPDIAIDDSISVYPNPSKGMVNINCASTIKSVQMYDIQGRLLQTSLVNKNQTDFDLSNQSNGVYFLKVISENGIGVKKIVKE
ncbi:T9SS type A sorting domain-containing protein [Flavobacterium sp. 25HG05S-40]|uniref:T9SS type A sorting domain-containing protein n=1 Tax=Flavobacterium sp. 25HG05S-40 TaxID=3458682 RepID=UPI0040443161